MEWNDFIDASARQIAGGMVQPLSFLDKDVREGIYRRVAIGAEDDRTAQVTKLSAWLTRHCEQLRQRETENYARRLKKFPVDVGAVHSKITNKLADVALDILKAAALAPGESHLQ